MLGLCSDLDAGERERYEQNSLQAEFAALRVVPFAERVRAAALTAAADRNCRNSLRERNIGVGGTAFEARAIAEKAIDVANRFEERRIFGKFSGGPCAEGTKIQL